MVRWLTNMLESRIIQSTIISNTATKFVKRGTTWLLVVNDILLELDKDKVKVVAYADNGVILVSGPRIVV